MEYTDYTGLVEYDGTLFKIVMGAGYNGTYDMASDRIISGGGFLDFLLQLHSKEWATGQHIKDFLDCFEKWCVAAHGKYPQEFLDVIGGMNRWHDHPGDIEPNVKEHAPPPANERSETGVEVQATLDSADKAAGGGCRASACSPSSLFTGDSESSKELIGKVQFFRDGTWAAYGAVDQTICSLPEYHAQSTNSSSDL